MVQKDPVTSLLKLLVNIQTTPIFLWREFLRCKVELYVGLFKDTVLQWSLQKQLGRDMTKQEQNII